MQIKQRRLISAWIGVRSRSISGVGEATVRRVFSRVSSGVSRGVGCWWSIVEIAIARGLCPGGTRANELAISCEIIRRVHRRACRRKSRFKSLLIELSLSLFLSFSREVSRKGGTFWHVAHRKREPESFYPLKLLSALVGYLIRAEGSEEGGLLRLLYMQTAETSRVPPR